MARAYWLHGGGIAREKEQAFGKVSLRVPELSPEEIRAELARLREGAGNLAGVDKARRRWGVAAAARRFLDPADPLRCRAVDLLPGVTGFSPSMIQESLPRIFRVIEESALASVISAEDGAAVPLVVIVAAGNVPGVAIPKMALALAAGSACFVKSASGEPVLAPLFAQALCEALPELGGAVGVSWWPGGDRRREEEVARAAASLIAYGSDEAVAALRSLAPAAFVGYGHRLSVAVVRLDDPTRMTELAAAAALDVALYDQLGCLSPQAVYTLGGDSATRNSFGDALARELEALSQQIPRGELPESAALAIRRLRDEVEWREIRGAAVRLRMSRAGALWTVIEDPEPVFRPSPLYRTIFVRPLERLSAFRTALEDVLPQLECVGVGPWPDAELDEMIRGCGIPHRAPLGRMQAPGLDWRQRGLSPLAGIVPSGSP